MELVSGQNLPWPDGRVTAYVAGAPVAAVLLDSARRACAPLVDEETGTCDGVSHLRGDPPGITVVLADVPPTVDRVLVVATSVVPGGASPALTLLSQDGEVVATYGCRPTVERAVVLCEVYRRGAVWKVRASGQGWAGGMDALRTVHGLPATAPHATSSGAGTSAAAAAPHAAVDPVRRLAMVMEDASRSTAALQASQRFAEERLHADLESLLGDPAMRVGPAGDAARAEARRRHDVLVTEATTRHAADLQQLAAEVDALERGLPAPLARWSSPAWSGAPSGAPANAPVLAFRLGELALPEAPGFRMPMAMTLPVWQPVWVDSSDAGEATAGRVVAGLAVRVVAAQAPRPVQVTVVDVGRRHHGLGLGAVAVVRGGPAAASEAIREHLHHVDLVRMALRAGSVEDLGAAHAANRLLVLLDVPGGLDEPAVVALRTLVADGPRHGVTVLASGAPMHGLGIPALESLEQEFLRIPSAPGGDLVDGFAGVAWTFHPDVGPGAEVLSAALARVTADAG